MNGLATPAEAGTEGAPKRICIVGAPGTGKTRLARELAGHFPGIEIRESHPAEGDAILLMGLDLPGSQIHAAEDARQRAALQAAGIAYQVVYGQGPQRLQSALAALGRAPAAPAAPAARDWQWSCEKCSDPDCEHRLFRRLLGDASSPG